MQTDKGFQQYLGFDIQRNKPAKYAKHLQIAIVKMTASTGHVVKTVETVNRMAGIK